jgi:hypothetical protein
MQREMVIAQMIFMCIFNIPSTTSVAIAAIGRKAEPTINAGRAKAQTVAAHEAAGLRSIIKRNATLTNTAVASTAMIARVASASNIFLSFRTKPSATQTSETM